MPIDLKEQKFGVEIEMTGLTREEAAEALSEYWQSYPHHSGGGYDTWTVDDEQGKTWKLMSDSSIHALKKQGTRYVPTQDSKYKVEMVTPVLTYEEMGKLQEAVRCLRRVGARIGKQCGMHVHVDAANHTPQSLKNALSIMYSKEDILFKALKVNESRVEHWCQPVREEMLRSARRLPTNTSMARLRNVWYEGEDGSRDHYDFTRYHALNLHSVFYRGTLEWRCFESTLHAGKVRANVTLALAISAQAINQRCAHMHKTAITENPCFTFRTFLLRLGLIGPEFKNVREHLLSNLEGDRAWRYDKSNYASLQKQKVRQEPER